VAPTLLIIRTSVTGRPAEAPAPRLLPEGK
jgi:hypothetical protein